MLLKLKCIWFFLLAFLVLAQATPARAAPGVKKTYLLTSTYGVLVGTLTGVASLAFYENPGQKKRNIALGASLGLYTGIMLGTYVMFLAPDPNAPKEAPAEEDEEAKAEPFADPNMKLAMESIEAKNTIHWVPVLGWDFETKSVQVGMSYYF